VRIYLDSSALLKRVILEDESEALVEALDDWVATGNTILASSLAWVEVARACQVRAAQEPIDLSLADDALAGVSEHPVSPQVIALARRAHPPVLRTLDALHLASALILDVDTMVTYDHRLADACTANHLDVAAPGR
jgi:uncharacterized protein